MQSFETIFFSNELGWGHGFGRELSSRSIVSRLRRFSNCPALGRLGVLSGAGDNLIDWRTMLIKLTNAPTYFIWIPDRILSTLITHMDLGKLISPFSFSF